jgi:hypothetical protein
MRPELHLLRKIERLPADVKVPVGPLARELGVTQATALSMIEWLVNVGRIDARTLRPPHRMPAQEFSDDFKHQLKRVERGEAKIAPVVRVPPRAPLDRTYGGVSSAYDGPGS